MRIAIATCYKMPEGTKDDQFLLRALEARGHTHVSQMWTDPRASWEGFDAILLRSPWDYYEKLPDFLDWCERQKNLFNPYSTVRTNAVKDYLFELQRFGMPIVPSWVLDNKEEAISRSRELLKQGKLIVKPAVSGGSYLTYFLENDSTLEACVDRVLAHGKVLLQPYLPSVATEGEVSLMYFRVGKKWEYAHSVVKNAKAGDFRVQTNFGGRTRLWEPNTACEMLARRVLDSLSPEDLYVRIDLLDWATKPLIGEIELIEPALYFKYNPASAELLVKALEAI